MSDYRDDLLERLRDPDYMLGYLKSVLAEDKDPGAFLLALRDVVQARGVTEFAQEADLLRGHIYVMLSERGNPTLTNLYAILNALDLRLTVVPKKEVA